MSAQAVLYDHPGPKAIVRNRAISVIFILVIAAALYFVISGVGGKGELAGTKWKPFASGDVWTNILLPGLWATIKAALISVVIALPIGGILAIARLSDHFVVRAVATAIVEFFRAIPVLLLMFFAYQFYIHVVGLDPKNLPLYSVITGLVLYNATVLAEIFRSGVHSLPKGQTEAGVAIGLRKGQLMTIILLPQALTAMLPAIVSQLVVILKDTALGSILVHYPELMDTKTQLTSNGAGVVATYVVIALLFIAMNFTLTELAGFLEKQLRNRGGARKGGPRVDIAVAASLPVEVDLTKP